MPVAARRWLRRMRGGAQGHLIEAADGHCYVMKARNNPQHRRILVNEWISAVLLRYLQVATPEPAILIVDSAFLAEYPECAIQLGSRSKPVEPGWHFGSRTPGPPERVAVFDFLPEPLLDKVVNRHDFAGVLLFDKWVCNADARQAIFFRAQVNDRLRERPGFVAWMIDHGFAFDGPHWKFNDAPLCGLYSRREVYRGVSGWNDLEPWLTRIEHFPEQVVDEALRQIPPEWFAEDDEALLQKVLEKLMTRRRRLRALVEDQLVGKGSLRLFPNWR